jgi:hypothetical protein
MQTYASGACTKGGRDEIRVDLPGRTVTVATQLTQSEGHVEESEPKSDAGASFKTWTQASEGLQRGDGA